LKLSNRRNDYGKYEPHLFKSSHTNGETITENNDIREKAVAIYKGKAVNVDEMSRDDVANLIHELGIHQIELELQNEELNRAHAELARSHDMYTELYDFAPVGYLTINADGIIERANLTISTMLGLARSKLIGNRFSAFILTEFRDTWHRCFVQIVDNPAEPGSPCQLQMQNAGGDSRWVQLIAAPVNDPAGRLQALRVALSDITGLKEAQHAQKKLSDDVQTKNRLLQNILHAASHDLRAPLVTIIGFAEELIKSCRCISTLANNQSVTRELRDEIHDIVDNDMLEYARFVKSAASRMDALLKGLLEVCRLGAEPACPAQIDMNDVIDEVIASLQFDIAARKASVTRQDLPPCLGEPLHTPRVFANLIHNALKFLDPNRPGRIHVSAQPLTGKCIYRVADNGVGIRPEDQERIFDMFYRSTPANVPEGEGLGLTIVTRILERQNGKIWVHSTPDRGSTFSVLLPTPPQTENK